MGDPCLFQVWCHLAVPSWISRSVLVLFPCFLIPSLFISFLMLIADWKFPDTNNNFCLLQIYWIPILCYYLTISQLVIKFACVQWGGIVIEKRKIFNSRCYNLDKVLNMQSIFLFLPMDKWMKGNCINYF